MEPLLAARADDGPQPQQHKHLYAGSTVADVYKIRDDATLKTFAALPTGGTHPLEIYENQRFMPLTRAGFAAKHLTALERGPFSHGNGVPGGGSSGGYQPEPNDAGSPLVILPAGFEWAEPEGSGPAPATAGAAGSEESWRLEPSGPADGDGWEYAANWPQGLGVISWKGSDGRGLMVRRRRLVRTVVRTGAAPAPAPAAVAATAACAGGVCATATAAGAQPAVLTARKVEKLVVVPMPPASNTGLAALLGSADLELPGNSKLRCVANTAELLGGIGVIALYFSAHWCPPCRAFTPKLASWYKKHYERLGLQIVFVSSDKDEPGYDQYRASMPWPALPFAKKKAKADLSARFGVRGIPALIVLDAQGRLITADGRAELLKDPGAKRFPWGATSGAAASGGGGGGGGATAATAAAATAAGTPVVAATVVGARAVGTPAEETAGEKASRLMGEAGDSLKPIARMAGSMAATGLAFGIASNVGGRAMNAAFK
eukprot:SAG22_NODE_170_length_16713_cov_33.746298_6_plen_489_part_00